MITILLPIKIHGVTRIEFLAWYSSIVIVLLIVWMASFKPDMPDGNILADDPCQEGKKGCIRDR